MLYLNPKRFHLLINNNTFISYKKQAGPHQILCIEGDLIPPGGDKLIVTVEDAAVHVLVSPRIEKRFESTQPGEGEKREKERM